MVIGSTRSYFWQNCDVRSLASGAVWSLVHVPAERADSARTGTTVVTVVLLIADIGFS